MKNFKLNKLAVAAIAGASLSLTVTTAHACSKIAIQTADHGVVQVRTLDWSAPLGTTAKITPVGGQIDTFETGEYANMLVVDAKFATMSLEEYNVFHGTTAAARNSEGLIVDTLYQTGSYMYLGKHLANQNNGTAYIDLAKAPTVIASQYANVADFVKDIKSGKVDIAWSQGLMGAGEDARHGLHIGVQDASGDAILLQLGEDGKTVVYSGTIKDDANVAIQANDPLLPIAEAYVESLKVKPTDINYMNNIPAGIQSLDRYARLVGIHATHTSEAFAGKTEMQAVGALVAGFDQAATLAQGITNGEQKPIQKASDDVSGLNADAGMGWDDTGIYPTRVKYAHVLDSGFFSFYNTDTHEQIRFNVNDAFKNKTEVCADLVEAASTGQLVFAKCN